METATGGGGRWTTPLSLLSMQGNSQVKKKKKKMESVESHDHLFSEGTWNKKQKTNYETTDAIIFVEVAPWLTLSSELAVWTIKKAEE